MRYNVASVNHGNPTNKHQWPKQYIDEFADIIRQTDFPNDINIFSVKEMCQRALNFRAHHCAQQIFNNRAINTSLYALPVVESRIFVRTGTMDVCFTCAYNFTYVSFMLVKISDPKSAHNLTLNDVVF
jgi:hypothetical protein